MRSGVKESSAISPLFFSLYINDLIRILRSASYGCNLGDLYTGCLLFADNILLLSASLVQLQLMLHLCHQYCVEWDLVFNVKKSYVMVLDKDDELLLLNKTLVGGIRSWVKKIKYLGVFLK